MKYAVVHLTRYAYAEPVTTSHHEIHLTPRDGEGQECLAHSVEVIPSPSVQRERLDFFKNRTVYFGIHEPHRVLEVIARSEVRVTERHRALPLWSSPWEEVRERVARGRTPELLGAYAFAFDSPYVKVGEELRELARPSFSQGRPLLEALVDLTRRIHVEFQFDPTATRISTPLAHVLRHRRGVCQDFAHVQIGCLRAMGLPGRYVSGYLMTIPPPGQPRLVGADASHAWVSTYFPDVGWLDFDPLNNMIPKESHIVLGYGRDFGDVTPLRGVIQGGGRHTLHVSVDVTPLERRGVPS